MTLFEELTAAGLPVIDADENGAVSMGGMTFQQMQTFQDVLLQHFKPTDYTELLDRRNSIQQLKDNYQTAITRLEQIQAAATPTNAQVIQAIRDMALIQERTLKALRQMFI